MKNSHSSTPKRKSEKPNPKDPTERNQRRDERVGGTKEGKRQEEKTTPGCRGGRWRPRTWVPEFPGLSLLRGALFISVGNRWPELYKTRNQVIFCDRFGFYFLSVRNVTANLPDSFEFFHLSFPSLPNSHSFTWRGVTAELLI